MAQSSHAEGLVEGYDVIGDIHGCAAALVRLLQKLGYQQQHGIWQHSSRKAVFVGDVIDRGPEIRRAVNLVRGMVEQGHAYMVLGNHEFNAVAYSTLSQRKVTATQQRYYRHLGRHLRASLEDYRYHLPEWKELIVWLRSLPVFLELPSFRVVHACWDQHRIDQARAVCDGRVLLDNEFLADSVQPGSEPNRIVERLLKGTDLELPGGLTMTGSDGVRRKRFRTKFWSSAAQTYGDVVFQPDALPADLVDQPLTDRERRRLLSYGAYEKTLFVGHYWCQGTPRVIRDNLACLDYSAVKQGLLVAYRLGKEEKLNDSGFVWVDSNH